MIRLGVIGLGNRIRNGVMPSLLGYSDEFVITDVYDSHRALVEEEIAKKESGYAENIRWYDSPEELVEKTPIDGLCGKTDEENLGFTYAQLDRYIRTGEIDDPEIKELIDRKHKMNLFKLEFMPCFKPEL